MKIFCVGLPKTGTTSLEACLIELGYKVAPYNLDFINSIADIMSSNKVEDDQLDRIIKNEIDNYDAFQDWPYPLLVQSLYTLYPDSHFILTIRKDEKVWLKSLQKHTKRNSSEKSRRLRSIFYGNDDPFLNGILYEKFYLKHNKNIINKFNNDKRFLAVCFETGDGWQQICEFLNKEIPNKPLPHVNNTASKKGINYFLERRINRLKLFIKNLLKKFI